MPKKVTTEDFIYRAGKIHGNKFDYSMSQYTDSYTKIKITCRTHGVFEQSSGDHLGGKGCWKCGRESAGLKKRKSQETFIQEANCIHNNLYNYSVTNYVNENIKIDILCNIHGIFSQNPGDHLTGHGCKKCAIERNLVNRSEFIEKAQRVHGNRFDYTLVKTSYITHKVSIICKEHGIFEQIAGHHLTGQQCFRCVCDSKRNSINYTESYESYISYVKAITENSYKIYRGKINPLNLERGCGIGKYHIDHIYSKCEGFKNNILPEIVGHWTNLQMLKHEVNSSKNDRCDKTVEQLYEDYYKEIK